MSLLGRLVAALGLVSAGAWDSAAVWFRSPLPVPLRGILVAGIALLALAAAIAQLRERGTRRTIAFLVATIIVSLWWSRIEPRNDREWLPDVARPATAEIDGDIVTIHNIRNFHYRTETDYDEHWEERRYDLSKLTGADLFLSYWGSPSIAHTIVSWEFSDSLPLAISIETRKEKGEEYSTVKGFFREYELYYVVADERDLIGLRTNHRGETVYLYRVGMPVDRARALFVDYLTEVNRLAQRPRWYNALTHNCTTSIRGHMQDIAAAGRWNWRILVNGYIDQLMYERGVVNTSMPYEELRKISNVTEKAKAAGDDDPRFSEKIREGIPSPTTP